MLRRFTTSTSTTILTYPLGLEEHQYNDALTGLDYYNARYYDPVAGVFLSADVKQGNRQGMNPYAYVGGNPETQNDPTGERTVRSVSQWDVVTVAQLYCLLTLVLSETFV